MQLIKKRRLYKAQVYFQAKFYDVDDDAASMPLKSTDKSEIVGPTLPPSYTEKSDTKLNASPKIKNTKRKFGPSLEDLLSPTTEVKDNNEDDVIVGPVLPGVSRKLLVVEEKDNEAEKWQKIKDTGSLHTNTNKPKRDEWISVPPPTRTGVVARTHFSRKDQSGLADQSVWVDTPAEKAAKAASKKGDNENEFEAKKAIEMDNMINKYNEKKRSKTLIEAHKEAKASVATVEAPKDDYDPFDREKVLGITKKIPDKKRNELLKEAKKFNSNFERGSYLT